MVSITPEMARAELARRKGLSSNIQHITPEMARTELDRRKQLNVVNTPKESLNDNEDILNKAGRSLARIPRNAVGSVLDVADFIATPIREGLNLGAKAIGINARSEPIADKVTNLIDTATGGYTAPQSNSEKVEEAIQRGIMSMPVGGGLGTAIKSLKHAPQGIKALGNFLSNSNVLTPSNIASTAGTSGVVQHILNENPDDKITAVLAGLGAGTALGNSNLLSQAGRNMASKNLGTAIGDKLQINPSKIETFSEAGITPMLPDVSNSKLSKMITSTLEHTPFSGSTIQNAKQLQREQVLRGLGQGDYGENLGKVRAAELTKKGAQKYQKEQNKIHRQLFDKLEKDIEKLPDDMITPSSSQKYFENIFKKFRTKSQEESFLRSPIGKMYKSLYEESQKNGGRLPYYDLKDRLSQINDMITTHGLIGKESQGKLKGFANAMAQDIERDLSKKFNQLGGDSLENWNKSKSVYKDYAQGDIPKLNEIYKKDKKGATDAFVDLLTNQKKGAEKTKIVLQGLDHNEQIDLINNVNKEFGKASDGSFSPLKWARNFNSLEPESKKILLSPLDDNSKKKINAIAESIDSIRSTLNEANTSKTAYYNKLHDVMTGGLAVLGGNIISPVKIAGGLLAGKLISDKVITNPKFINWMYNSMKAKNIDQFQKMLNHPPKVGSLSKGIQREIQMFQRDLTKSQEENEK